MAKDDLQKQTTVSEDESIYASLLLTNQLCFPLYACSKEIVRRYKPLLDELDLTYTQYITMMVMWEHKTISSKELGSCLMLDSGTLTPVLKKLEQKGYLTRSRDEKDERNLKLVLTEEGLALRDRALTVPVQMASKVHLSPEEAQVLAKLLHELLGNFQYNRII